MYGFKDGEGVAVPGDLVSVEQAAHALGVKPATVYAYISRGQLSSRRLPEDRRSWLSRDEVERFGRRRGARPLASPMPLPPSEPSPGSAGAGSAGAGTAGSGSGTAGSGTAGPGSPGSGQYGSAPSGAVVGSVEHTSVGEIVGDRLLLRGWDACELAASASYAQVAELLWTGKLGPDRLRQPDGPLLRSIAVLRDAMPESGLPLDRMKSAAMLLGAADPFRYDLSRPAVLSAARTLVPAFVAALPARAPSRLSAATAEATATAPRHAGTSAGLGGPDTAEDSRDLTGALWARLATTPATSAQSALLSAALVLLADHGIGPSTRAAREAAASAADPYSVVLAGMSVASGLLLGGGSSLAVQAWLEEIDSVAAVPRVLADRLLRGDRISGFGQPRYRGADPRGALLLELLAASQGDEQRQEIVRAVVRLVRERRVLAPNVEFALGAICFVHRMPRGAGEAVFVIARSAGWIAHAVEVYERASGEHP